MWRHPWPEDIISNLVYYTHRNGTITNSDLELDALVLHEATLLAAVPDDRLAAPCSGYDNNPAVSWIKKEALTINPVIADLLRLRALNSRQFFLHPSVFNHPGTKNRMADNASRLLNFHLFIVYHIIGHTGIIMIYFEINGFEILPQL